MTIEADILDHLASDVNVTSIVDDKIFSRRHPPKVNAPFIVFRRVSTLSTMSHDGPGLRGARFEFACWGSDGTESGRLRRAVANAFDVVRTATFWSFIETELEAEFPTASLPRSFVDVRLWYDAQAEFAAS